MISQRTIRSLGNFLRFENLFLFSCLNYDDSSLQLCLQKSKFQNFLFLLNNFHLYSYTLINIYDLLQQLKIKDDPFAIGQIFFLLIYGINRSWGALTRSQVWTRRYEIVHYFNCLTNFSVYFHKGND